MVAVVIMQKSGDDDDEGDGEDLGKAVGSGKGVSEFRIWSKIGCGAGVGILEKSRASNGSI